MDTRYWWWAFVVNAIAMMFTLGLLVKFPVAARLHWIVFALCLMALSMNMALVLSLMKKEAVFIPSILFLLCESVMLLLAGSLIREALPIQLAWRDSTLFVMITMRQLFTLGMGHIIAIGVCYDIFFIFFRISRRLVRREEEKE